MIITINKNEYTKIVDTSVDAFTVQAPSSGFVWEILFSSTKPAASDLGVIVRGGVDTTIGRQHGTNHLWAKVPATSPEETVDLVLGNLGPTLAEVQGLFLPSDIAYLADPGASALYQDAAGTTPAVFGGPVGLRVNVSGVSGMPNASQGTTALCPILRQTPTTQRRWLEAPDADDALNLTFASAPGTMYVGRLTAEGVEWVTETWGKTVNTVRQNRYNSALIARSREFTANEKALVEQYWARYMTVCNLIAPPDPLIGDAFAGGYYIGDAWDSVAYSRSSLTIGTGTHTLWLSDLSAATNRARTPDDPDLPFYIGQSIKLAPYENTGQVFMSGMVTGRSGGNLTILVSDVVGSGTFDSWVIAAQWRVVLAPKDGGESTVDMMYKTEDTRAPVECRTLTNGRAATAAMIAANSAEGSIIYPAAEFIRGVNAAALSGYTDWELPARDWLELLWRNLKPVTLDQISWRRPKSNSYIRDANTDDIADEVRGLNRHSVPAGASYTETNPSQTPLPLFQLGGAQAPQWEALFWSSSEYSETSACSQVWATSSPGGQRQDSKTVGCRVRAVRREIL